MGPSKKKTESRYRVFLSVLRPQEGGFALIDWFIKTKLTGDPNGNIRTTDELESQTVALERAFEIVFKVLCRQNAAERYCHYNLMNICPILEKCLENL